MGWDSDFLISHRALAVIEALRQHASKNHKVLLVAQTEIEAALLLRVAVFLQGTWLHQKVTAVDEESALAGLSNSYIEVSSVCAHVRMESMSKCLEVKEQFSGRAVKWSSSPHQWARWLST